MENTVNVRLPDGTSLTANRGDSIASVVAKIGARLERAAVAAKVDGTPTDLGAELSGDCLIEVITFASRDGRDIYWHSSSHLMAQAVKRLYPNAKFAIGPAIEGGFYYDIDLEKPLTPEDLLLIEDEMKRIVAEDIEIKRFELSRADAIKRFSERGEVYKAEMLGDMDSDTVTLYSQGEFEDLCRGPHVRSTGAIKAFKLLSVAGAYWRGDEKNKMLQRIYGISFPDKKDLDKHLEFLEEAKKRDHRKLGRELELYSTHDDAGGGLIYWHPKGGRLRLLLEDWWRTEHFKHGYEILYTPHIGRSTLWETSGHLGFYSENMYSPMKIDDYDYYIKPMNCPFHIKIYQTKMHSYRDLPLRWAELGTVYRYEKSGVLHGLLRVRGFTQDDAHIFCTPEQIGDEVREVLRFSLFMWKELGFADIKAYIATRPEDSVGEPSRWQQAQDSLLAAVKAEGISVEIDEGGGAFYGPKIDLKVRDTLGREWQMTTIQFDFNLPERFDLYYIGEDGQRHRPYMVHRALLGSIERFIGILIEHYGGRFPVWLSPVQAVLASVSDDESDYVRGLAIRLVQLGLRVESDIRSESIGYKVRDAISKKVPFLCVIGKKEIENGTLAVRRRGEDKNTAMNIDDFICLLSDSEKEHRKIN